jgi:hypothetical protein
MGYNIHDVLNKTVVYIQENIKIKKINFWLWFEIIIILKTKH